MSHQKTDLLPSPSELKKLEQASALMQWNALHDAASKGLLQKDYGLYQENDKVYLTEELVTLYTTAGKTKEDAISLTALSNNAIQTREAVERLISWRATGMRYHPKQLPIPQDTPGFSEALTDYETHKLPLRRKVFQDWMSGATKDVEGFSLTYEEIIRTPETYFDSINDRYNVAEELGIDAPELREIVSSPTIKEKFYRKRLNRLATLPDIHPFVVKSLYEEAQGFGVSEQLLQDIDAHKETRKYDWLQKYPNAVF